MGLILSSNGPNLPSEILVSYRPVLFPACTLYHNSRGLLVCVSGTIQKRRFELDVDYKCVYLCVCMGM